jgi:microcystin degradation protein MlrC
MRIGVGRFDQETNTFSPSLTDLDAFRRQGYDVGDAFDIRGGARIRSTLWTFAEVADARGDVELVPLVKAWTGPSGRVTTDAFEDVASAFLRRLDEVGDLDVVYLSLHGAMAAEHHDDPEGLLLEMVRAAIGPDVWLVASTDHHANITERMVANSHLIVGHRTQPHDPPHTGKEMAEALFRVVDGNMTPTVAMRKAPMITHQEQYRTHRPPMKVWFDLAREMESRPGVISASTYPMQPWLDVEEGGWASIVYTDDDPELADELAKELTRCVWGLRHDLMVQESIPVSEAIARANQVERGIVVLSDTGDSAAGGATGDSNVILAEMLRQGVKGLALVPMVDAPAALAAAEAGIGAIIEVRLGRSLDPTWGDPITVTAEVLNITDGWVDTGGFYEPYTQGTSALLGIGDIRVAVSQFRGRTMNMPPYWAHYGVDATDRDAVQMVVVKTASNFQYFGEWTSEVIRVDTPGHTQSRVTDFDWQRLPRPIFPLDADAALDFS